MIGETVSHYRIIDQLGEGDTVALTTYAGATRLVLEPTGMHERARIHEAIDSLQTSRSTHLEAGLTLGQLSAFISSFFVGAIILQYPLGWLSDRMDRRRLIWFSLRTRGVKASREIDRVRRQRLAKSTGGPSASGG